MSFEFYGGMLALDLFGERRGSEGASGERCGGGDEASGFGGYGDVTSIGALMQLATIFGEFV